MGSMVRVILAVALPEALVAVMVKAVLVKVPVGVPVIRPVVVLKLSPLLKDESRGLIAKEVAAVP